MKLLFVLLPFAVLFISGCATQQTQPTKSSSPTLSPTQTGDVKHYSIKSQEPPISLVTDIENVVNQIADCYYKISKKTLTVTSGTRGSDSQAQAMFDKLKLGDNLDIYSNKVARDQIKKAYDDSVSEGKGNSEIVADMAAVIENQIAAGTYISNHLRSGAVDFSQNGMTTSDKTTFEQCANSVSGVTSVIDEGAPVHYHLEITSSVVEEPTQSPTTITPSSSPTATVEKTISITPTPEPTPTQITPTAEITSTSCTEVSRKTVFDSANNRNLEYIDWEFRATGTATSYENYRLPIEGLQVGGTWTLNSGDWSAADGVSTGPGGSRVPGIIRNPGQPETTTWSITILFTPSYSYTSTGAFDYSIRVEQASKLQKCQA